MAKKRESLSFPKEKTEETVALTGADLLGGENQAIQRLIGARAHTQLSYVRVEDIDTNPFNPRQNIEVTELVESMREHGFIGALDGRLQGRRVQLAYGARRLAAARAAGIEQIPVYLHPDWDDNTLLTISLVENVQREDLTPLETALAILQMNENLGWSQRDIAKRTGKSHSWVRDMLAVAKAGADVQDLVRERPDAIRHARFIAQVEDEATRQRLAQATQAEELTVDQVYRTVQAVRAGSDVDSALAEAQRTRVTAAPPPPAVVLEEPAAAPAETPAASLPSSEPAAVTSPALPHAAEHETRPAGKRTVAQVLAAVQAQLARLDAATIQAEAQLDAESLLSLLQGIRQFLADIEAALTPTPAADVEVTPGAGEAA
jgi:ParB family chromosome partitioning protein